MNDTFLKLDKEKQQRIINAALLEFAEKGYKYASTNEIVKRAGIGKGMLFYYFNSKKELYYFLVNYCIDSVMEQFVGKIDTSITDVIERLAHISYLKLKYFKENPEISHFLVTFFLKETEPLPEELQKKYERMFQIGMDKVYVFNQIQYDSFRDDIDPKKAVQLIEWMLSGYQRDFMQKYQGKGIDDIPLDELWNDFDEYLQILKTCFYK